MGVASCSVVSELVIESFLTLSPLWSYTYTGSAGPVRMMYTPEHVCITLAQLFRTDTRTSCLDAAGCVAG